MENSGAQKAVLKKIANDLWVAEHPLSTLGIEYGVRMTIVRLANSDLLLISPVRLTDDLARQVSELGRVRYLFAPNSFHHIFMADWVKKFPDAELWVVPQMVKKRPDLRPTRIVDEKFQWPGGDDIKLLFVPGGKLYSEAVLCHVPSKTLIVTDLCFNLHKEQGLLPTLLMKFYGVYKKFGPSKAVALFMGDKKRLRAAIDHMGTWDFNRVIVAHGEIWENATPKDFVASFASIL